MTLPDAAQYIMERISASGGVAYLVGGAVRDLLSGETPRDCDIATNLPPERVMSVFPNAVPTGIKHGTVTIPTPHGAVEVTTFRRDGSYSDNRRPDSVTWTDDLYEDLSRRDFTIGAMAMDIDGNLTDPFGGAADLKTRTIRAVGDPDTRFKEDALRMLRAFRFAARGYTIDPPTLAAIERNAHLAASLAPERVAQELRLTLESENPDTAFCLLSHNLLTPFLPNCDSTLVMPEACKAIFSQPCVVPEACLQASHGGLPPFLALACPGNSERAARALKLDAHTVADCRAIDETPPPRTAADLKHLFCTLGDRRTLAVASCALKNFITEQYSGAHCVSGASRLTCRNPSASDMYAAAIEIIASGEPRNLSMLAVNGDDLAALGISGKKTGDTLRRLFDIVVADPTLNTKEYLLSVCANTQ